MPFPLYLPARRNGRRIARDSAPENPENDIHRLAAYAQGNLTRDEIKRVITMLQSHLDESEEALDGPPDWKGAPIPGTMRRVGEDSRRRYQPMSREAEAEFMKMFPDAGRLK
jgi:signal recognition particle subunit SEC65